MDRASSQYSDMDTGSDLTSFRGEEVLVDASLAAGGPVVHDKVFVAVGREVKASKSTLVWALQNAGTKKVVIVHVHQPAQTISILGGKFPISQLGEREVKAHREMEREKVLNILEEYVRMCSKAGVQQVEKEYIEMASIEGGIVELINKFKIGLLVMGAAADNKYSRKMIEPKSKKAVYVRQHAPPSCHIWFACKGRLIYTREGTLSSDTGEGAVTEQRLVDTDGVEIRRSSSASLCNSSTFTTPWSRSVAGQSSFDELDQSSTMSIRLSFGGLSPRSETAGNSPFLSTRTQDRDPEVQLSALPPIDDELHRPSFSNISTSSMNDHLYEHLEQAMAEAETSKRQAFEESTRRRKAEKDTMDAMRKAKLAENMYFDELRRRKQVEEELAKSKEEVEDMTYEIDGILEKLRIALDEKALLENRLERSDEVVKEMEAKVMSVLELLKVYNKQ